MTSTTWTHDLLTAETPADDATPTTGNGSSMYQLSTLHHLDDDGITWRSEYFQSINGQYIPGAWHIPVAITISDASETLWGARGEVTVVTPDPLTPAPLIPVVPTVPVVIIPCVPTPDVPAPVPEPATVVMLLIALIAGLIVHHRRT